MRVPCAFGQEDGDAVAAHVRAVEKREFGRLYEACRLGDFAVELVRNGHVVSGAEQGEEGAGHGRS